MGRYAAPDRHESDAAGRCVRPAACAPQGFPGTARGCGLSTGRRVISLKIPPPEANEQLPLN